MTSPARPPRSTRIIRGGWISSSHPSRALYGCWAKTRSTVSDPLVRRHPHSFGIKMVRASLNPPSSLANILRGRFPWWRDYEHPSDYESLIVKQFEHAMDVEPREHGDLYFHYRSLSLGTNNGSCFECRISTTGAGLQLAVAVRQYLDVVADIGFQPGATPVSSR